jgi:hypothetical protein
MALIAALPAGMLFFGSALWFSRARTAAFLLQLFGSGALVIVVLCHLCEALGLFPWMGWGLEQSAGHYLDLSSAIIALTLFPAGFLLNALRPRNS